MVDALSRFAPNERHETLPNGARLHILPRPDFHQFVGMVTVDFGARDQMFLQDGQLVKQPAGLAHFLEHKLFAQPGYDAFSRMSELGANANAFTTQTRTSYFMTAPANEYAAFSELLHFTQEPYFEESSVVRERDIISQEVDMYQDDTNARLYRLILGQLFPGDPMADDIAGTTESVHSVTPEDLQLAFDAFYRPDNMDVVIAGAFDETTVRDLINASPAGQRPAVAPVSVPTHELQPVSDDIFLLCILPFSVTLHFLLSTQIIHLFFYLNIKFEIFENNFLHECFQTLKIILKYFSEINFQPFVKHM